MQQLAQFKAEFFKSLAHPLRIRILEAIRQGEKTVNEIQAVVQVESSAVSQQLAVLRAKNIVVGDKRGTNVFYTVKDPLVYDLLDVARSIFNNHLIDTISLLQEIGRENTAGREK